MVGKIHNGNSAPRMYINPHIRQCLISFYSNKYVLISQNISLLHIKQLQYIRKCYCASMNHMRILNRVPVKDNPNVYVPPRRLIQILIDGRQQIKLLDISLKGCKRIRFFSTCQPIWNKFQGHSMHHRTSDLISFINLSTTCFSIVFES